MSTNKRSSPSNILAKECIVDALLRLTCEKSMSSVSISELCKKAGVSRMTFYRNYKSIEDIFLLHLAEIFEQYKAEDPSPDSGLFCDRAHILHYFDSVYQYRLFLDGLVRCGFDVIFLNMLTDYLCSVWAAAADKYILTSFAGSLYNLFRLWSRNNYQEDRTQLTLKLLTVYAPETFSQQL